MDSARASLLAELESTGQRHDATELRRDHRLLNITAETGRFLAVLTDVEFGRSEAKRLSGDVANLCNMLWRRLQTTRLGF